MIAGARSLQRYQQDLEQADTRGPSVAENSTSNTTVVFYCTTGYRSGMEATHCLHRYQTLQKATVYNLDGVVAYTQVLADQQLQFSDDFAAADEAPIIGLVDPVTQRPVREVHVFGSMWNFVDPDHFTTTQFAPHILLLRLLQVGGLVVGRSLQLSFHWMRRCCDAC